MIRSFLYNTDNNYWKTVDITINGNTDCPTVIALPRGIIHELIPETTMTGDIYSYEFSFDDEVPEESETRSCIMALFLGVIHNDESDYESGCLIDIVKEKLSKVAATSMFRFIDKYVFPEKPEIITHVNNIIESLAETINYNYCDVFMAYQLLYYGIWGTRNAVNGYNYKYDKARKILIDAFDLQDKYTTDKKLSTKKMFITDKRDTTYTGASLFCETTYEKSSAIDECIHNTFTLLRVMYERGMCKLPKLEDQGIHSKYYLDVFGGDIIKDNLSEVNYSVDTFIKILVRQYQEYGEILHEGENNLYNAYTHFARIVPSESEKSHIKSQIESLTKKYSSDWDKMTIDLTYKKFLKINPNANEEEKKPVRETIGRRREKSEEEGDEYDEPDED